LSFFRSGIYWRGLRDDGISSVDTHVAGASALRGRAKPAAGVWPGWARLAILLAGSLALWAGLGWVAFRILKLA
jgi:hypothetical protein